MQQTGVAHLPLHGGQCPRWLFPRMVKLGGAISEVIVYEYGQEEFLHRIADPYFFQSLGCMLGFDWHSSGLTTTTCGALKVALNRIDLGISVAGGKGAASKNTLGEIERSPFSLSTDTIDHLQYSSRMAAKVDNCLVQDNYQLYHHSFMFTEKGHWAIIQQGLNDANKYARRYHWLSEHVTTFVQEPHSAICGEPEKSVLDLTAPESTEVQHISLDLVNENTASKYFLQGQRTLSEFIGITHLDMPAHHYIPNMHKRNLETLQLAYEIQPRTYEELVALRGIGAKTLRALALVSELVYGTSASWKDPAKFSFAHGGKDNIPYPVDTKGMEQTTEILKHAVAEAKVEEKDKLNALKRLQGITMPCN